MTVDFSAALTADIADLCRRIGTEPETVTGPLRTLSRDLALAVCSYVGLQVVLPDHGHPVVFTSFVTAVPQDDIATSLRLPLAALQLKDVKVDASSAIIFYAGTSGAFVDLAADLSYALELSDPASPSDDGQTARDSDGKGHAAANQPMRIRLDHDLTPSTFKPGLTGVADVSIVNRAVGFLMAEGFHPEDAHDELAQRATALGITVLVYATQLIRPNTDPEFML